MFDSTIGLMVLPATPITKDTVFDVDWNEWTEEEETSGVESYMFDTNYRLMEIL